MPVGFRPEVPSDAPKIHALTCAAFPSPLEANIVDALRKDHSLTLSLVAFDEDKSSPTDPKDQEIIGHVAFSPVTITPEPVAPVGGKWVGLGPISVLPSRQGQGIGGDLVIDGIETLRAAGCYDDKGQWMPVLGCVLLGEPKFYGKYGFESGQGLTLDGVPPEYFQTMIVGDEPDAPHPVGKVEYHVAFNNTLPEKGADDKH